MTGRARPAEPGQGRWSPAVPQCLQPAVNGAPRQPRHPGQSLNPTVAQTPRLGGRPEAQPRFIQARRQGRVLLAQHSHINSHVGSIASSCHKCDSYYF